jgi:hypothetical protein
MAHELSRLKLDYPLWIISWHDEVLTARHLVTQQVLTASSIPDLRTKLEHPSQEASDD